MRARSGSAEQPGLGEIRSPPLGCPVRLTLLPRVLAGPQMLSYKEYDNAHAVEIALDGRVSTEEFEALAARLEAFIARHGRVRVLEIIQDFEGMDAGAFWQDVKFSLRHLHDFSRLAIVSTPDVHHLWSSLVAPFMRCKVEHFAPDQTEAARDWLMWPEGAADV